MAADATVSSSQDPPPAPELLWWRPAYLGEPNATAARSSMATPLLAGFSITLLGVIAQQQDAFRQPGMSIFLLCLAAVAFVMSVQCGFWARQYLVTPSEILNWYPGRLLSDPELQQAREDQHRGGRAYQMWERRAKTSYGVGLLGLLSGVCVALIPDAEAAQPGWRWAAAALASGMFLFELYWIFGARRKMKLDKAGKRSRVLDRWFSPVAALEDREARRAMAVGER